MQTGGFISGRDFLVRHETRNDLFTTLRRYLYTCKILGVRFLEESSLVFRFPFGIVVFDREQAVPQRTADVCRIPIEVSTVRTFATPFPGRSRLTERDSACRAISCIFAIIDFVEVPTPGTDEHVFCMSPVLCKKVAGKQIDLPAAILTVEHFDPEEGLDRNIAITVQRASRKIIASDFLPQRSDEVLRRLPIAWKVDVLDFFADDPSRHRIDVEALHVTTDSVRLDEGRPSAHEGVRDTSAREIVGAEERFFKRVVAELCQDQSAKQGARASSEPFVDAYDRTIILLDLFFSERHCRDQRNVEPLLDAHGDQAGSL